MTSIASIIKEIENFAPSIYQEGYDNAQLLTGNKDWETKGVLVSLDCIESVVEEAILTNCNLIVCHHPIIFSGLKSLTGKNHIERTIIKAIKNDIAIYAAHTNLDNVHLGVNKIIADKIGLKNTKILNPKKNTLKKLVVYCPKENSMQLRDVINQAGAGNIGKYENCSFSSQGEGFFTPKPGATPFIGSENKPEKVIEDRLEFLVPIHCVHAVTSAMQSNHPYEEVSFYLQEIENQNNDIGSGMIGCLDKEMSQNEFLEHLQNQFGTPSIKFTPYSKNIKNVAICGGSGSFLLPNAISQKADAFVTADFKYHEFFNAENRILIADIGHYESEVFTKEIFYEILNKKFVNIAIRFSEINTNPVQYFTKHG